MRFTKIWRYVSRNSWIIVVLSLVILLIGNFNFWIGFHNADTCRNEKELEYLFNDILKQYDIADAVILGETILDGERWSLDDCYLNGLNNMVEGLYISMVGCVLFGLSLMWRRQ